MSRVLQNCPKGLELKGGKCKSESKTHPTAVCEKGSSKTDKGCVFPDETEVIPGKIVDPKVSCPEDFAYKSGHCVKTSKSKAEVACPKGEHKGGKCHSEELVSPDYPAGKGKKAVAKCPDGYKKEKDSCVKKTEVDPEGQCPKGGELEGKHCVFTTKVVKNEFPAERPTKSPKLFKAKADKTHEGKKENRLLSAKEEPQKEEPKEKVKTHKEAATFACPKGLELKGHKCISEESVPFQFECPKGYVQGKDECHPSDVKPVCPKGTHESKESKGKAGCVRKVETEPTVSCPKGGELKGKECEVVETVAANPVCPKGTHMSKGSCVGESTVKPKPGKKGKETLECPKNYELKGKECKSFTEEDAVLVCSKGAELVGKECVSTEVVSMESKCPKGYTQSKGVCSKTSVGKPSYECPKDAEKKGSKCVQKVHSHKESKDSKGKL